MELSNINIQSIHNQLHSNSNTVSIGNNYYIVKTNTKGCRFVNIIIGNTNYMFMEQNKNTSSQYALRARGGENITWGFDKVGYLYRIDKDGVTNLSINCKQPKI